jgi:hypothetical protein
MALTLGGAVVLQGCPFGPISTTGTLCSAATTPGELAGTAVAQLVDRSGEPLIHLTMTGAIGRVLITGAQGAVLAQSPAFDSDFLFRATPGVREVVVHCAVVCPSDEAQVKVVMTRLASDAGFPSNPDAGTTVATGDAGQLIVVETLGVQMSME